MCANKNIPKFDFNSELSKTPYDLSANALKNVVQALVFGNKLSKIPYSDSKVTLLLR